MTITMPYQDKPLSYRLSKLAVHAQFVWWLGHLAVVLSTPLYILSLMVDKQNASRFYYRVFRGSMLSYGIVVWKGHKPLDISYSSLLKMFNDETTAYLSLACSWFFASPCLVSIFPFFVFSIFHCINYVRTRLFPTISPCAAEELKVYNAAVKVSASKNEAPPPKNLSPEANFFLKIQSLTLEYYAPAMKAVSLFELIAIPLYLLVEFLR
ncbi:Transmembrane nucleoporin, variant 2 [Entomophthora muscae]|nr:Transmembrane nucleoporin, variant 2 [Entomophthora muscae]